MAMMTKRSTGRGMRASEAVEIKNFDRVEAPFLFQISGALTHDHIVLIAQGVGPDDRIGRKCRLVSIDVTIDSVLNAAFKEELAAPTATALMTAQQSCRWVLVRDTQCNGVKALWANVFPSLSLTAKQIVSSKKRFKILHDHIQHFNPTAGGGDVFTGGTVTMQTGAVRKTHRIRQKLNIPMEFNSDFTDGRTATRTDNNLILMQYIDDASKWTMGFTSRVQFVG